MKSPVTNLPPLRRASSGENPRLDTSRAGSACEYLRHSLFFGSGEGISQPFSPERILATPIDFGPLDTALSAVGRFRKWSSQKKSASTAQRSPGKTPNTKRAGLVVRGGRKLFRTIGLALKSMWLGLVTRIEPPIGKSFVERETRFVPRKNSVAPASVASPSRRSST